MIALQDQFFVLKHSLVLVMSGFALYTLVPIGGNVDLALIYPFIHADGLFSLRQHWALAVLGHQYVKYLLIGVYVLLLGRWMASFFWTRLVHQRWQAGYLLAMAAISTAAIGLFKSQSAHACPWDMLTAAPQGLVWDFSATQGHCFPGGHAATGFALIAGYFIYWHQQPKRAYFYLVASLILGMAMGWTQMMRGAHFFSHNLWTAWVIYAINVLAYALFAAKLNNAVIEQIKHET